MAVGLILVRLKGKDWYETRFVPQISPLIEVAVMVALVKVALSLKPRLWKEDLR